MASVGHGTPRYAGSRPAHQLPHLCVASWHGWNDLAHGDGPVRIPDSTRKKRLIADDRLFIIPAARSPLRRVFICEKDIMLAYANGKARVWNTKTMEFRRSTGLDAAEDMLQTGKWTEV